MKRGLLIALVCLVLAPAARAGGPQMLVGVTEDEIRKPTLVATKAQMTIARLTGFDSVRISALWTPGQTEPPPDELAVLRNVATAGRLTGMRIFVAVYHAGSRTTPLTEEARADFAQYAAAIARRVPSFRNFIIGNEPNLNRFWLPQFNPDGSNAAAPAYMALLAKTYDALKEVSPRIIVIGGVLSPRGGDNPAASRHTHSPTKFIRDLGAAYRASGRTARIMDQFAMHPFQETSRQPPTARHPNSTTITVNDYPKLVRLLGRAFDGTAQPGSRIPIVYAEYGVEAQIPASKVRFYTGIEPRTTYPVPEATQASYYRQALQIAFCQPTVRAMMLFHLYDERDRNRWQSGMFYTDRTPRSTVAVVRRTAQESRRGIVARCPGMRLRIRVSTRFPAKQQLARAKRYRFRLRCDLDCAYTARIERLPGRTAAAVRRGRAVGGRLTAVTLPSTRLEPGRYRLAVTVAAAVNPGRPIVRGSAPFQVRGSLGRKPRASTDGGARRPRPPRPQGRPT